MAAGTRIGHLEPFAGASGAMLLGSALGAGADVDAVRHVLAGLGLPGWRLDVEQVRRRGLAATRARVTITGEEASEVPRTWREVRQLLFDADLPDELRERSYAVFHRLAQAEADLHGEDVDDVPVGAAETVLTVVAGCAALLDLGLSRLTASAVALGSGTLATAGSELPVPTPVTAELLRGVPTRRTRIDAELCTAIGAALLREWVDAWDVPGDLEVASIGYGAGDPDLDEGPSVLRLTVGTRPGVTTPGRRELVLELAAVLDDVPPELVGSAVEELVEAGALEVWTVPATTAEGRAGVALTCLCRAVDADGLERRLFVTTNTLAVRRRTVERTTLRWDHRRVHVEGRPVRIRVGEVDGTVVTAAPEHEDCRAVAHATRLPVTRVHDLAVAAYWQRPASTPPQHAAYAPPPDRAN